jgi:hypothetical protein
MMYALHVKRLFAVFALLVVAAIPAQAQNAKVKASMESLKTELNKLGPPKVEGENLFFGSSKINGDFTVVDAVKAKNGGTATVFVKKGGNYVRISTNVMKGDARAVGTPLDPSGPAKAAIDQGKAYFGVVDILGKMFDTGYEPIRTAKGETIGVYYVGYPLE